jgi:hypothetical protein
LQITGLRTGTHVIIAAVTVCITLTAGDRGKNTSSSRIAGINRAAIPVITADGSSLTVLTNANIIFCTGIVVITGIAVTDVLTTFDSITPIIGTNISVVTFKRCPINTLVARTALYTITYIRINTISILVTLTTTDRGIHTTGQGIAGVGRTAVPVITGNG